MVVLECSSEFEDFEPEQVAYHLDFLVTAATAVSVVTLVSAVGLDIQESVDGQAIPASVDGQDILESQDTQVVVYPGIVDTLDYRATAVTPA